MLRLWKELSKVRDLGESRVCAGLMWKAQKKETQPKKIKGGKGAKDELINEC